MVPTQRVCDFSLLVGGKGAGRNSHLLAIQVEALLESKDKVGRNRFSVSIHR